MSLLLALSVIFQFAVPGSHKSNYILYCIAHIFLIIIIIIIGGGGGEGRREV